MNACIRVSLSFSLCSVIFFSLLRSFNETHRFHICNKKEKKYIFKNIMMKKNYKYKNIVERFYFNYVLLKPAFIFISIFFFLLLLNSYSASLISIFCNIKVWMLCLSLSGVEWAWFKFYILFDFIFEMKAKSRAKRVYSICNMTNF